MGATREPRLETEGMMPEVGRATPLGAKKPAVILYYSGFCYFYCSKHFPKPRVAAIVLAWHVLDVEGGFTTCDRFVHLPIGADEGMLKVWQAAHLSLFLWEGSNTDDHFWQTQLSSQG